MNQSYFRSLVAGEDNDKAESSLKWLRDKAYNVETVKIDDVYKNNSSNFVKQVRLGYMYFFKYDALHKGTLPYFDTFPVIFVVKKNVDNFIGLNMHYLPFSYRTRFMDALLEYQTGENDRARLRITYEMLTYTSKLKMYRPCIKQYLNKQIRSKIIRIMPDDWNIVSFLPLQHFRGVKLQTVYRDSINSIKRQL